MPTIVKAPDGPQFHCAGDDTILRAALRAGIAMPYSCNTGSCGNCRFELLEGSVRHLRADPPASSERDLARNRWLGCQAAPDGDCRIKFREMAQYAPLTPPLQRDAEIVGITQITHDISEFRLKVDGDPAFAPGQYALLHAPGIEGGRAYSMSNLPDGDIWSFMIKRMPGGAATGWLFDGATRGDRLRLDGPYGTAYLRHESPRDLVLMAGGSGLSPMVSIAVGAQRAGMLKDRKLHFYYGGRRMADLCTADVLGTELAARVHFTAVLSDPETEWTGSKGFLHDAVQADLGAVLSDCDIYFAGPAVMSAAIQKMAHEAGVPPDRLYFDEFY